MEVHVLPNLVLSKSGMPNPNPPFLQSELGIWDRGRAPRATPVCFPGPLEVASCLALLCMCSI